MWLYFCLARVFLTFCYSLCYQNKITRDAQTLGRLQMAGMSSRVPTSLQAVEVASIVRRISLHCGLFIPLDLEPSEGKAGVSIRVGCEQITPESLGSNCLPLCLKAMRDSTRIPAPLPSHLIALLLLLAVPSFISLEPLSRPLRGCPSETPSPAACLPSLILMSLLVLWTSEGIFQFHPMTSKIPNNSRIVR